MVPASRSQVPGDWRGLELIGKVQQAAFRPLQSSGLVRIISSRVGHSPTLLADVAELADALASGASGGNPVEVQILSSALFLLAWKRLISRAFLCLFAVESSTGTKSALNWDKTKLDS